MTTTDDPAARRAEIAESLRQFDAFDQLTHAISRGTWIGRVRWLLAECDRLEELADRNAASNRELRREYQAVAADRSRLTARVEELESAQSIEQGLNEAVVARDALRARIGPNAPISREMIADEMRSRREQFLDAKRWEASLAAALVDLKAELRNVARLTAENAELRRALEYITQVTTYDKCGDEMERCDTRFINLAMRTAGDWVKTDDIEPVHGGNERREVIIPTLEGDHSASPGDWIIKGIKGEFYPCKPDIFAATYEAV